MAYDRYMSQNIGDLLSSRNFSEPPEIQLIKKFVHDRLGITPKVSITSDTYVVTLPSAAAAGTLRSHIYKLQKELETKKRILIRIG